SVATSSRLLCLISVISQYSSINFVHTLSLHDALPISLRGEPQVEARGGEEAVVPGVVGDARAQAGGHAVVEEVRQGQLGEVADAPAAAAEERRRRRGRDLVQGGGVGHGHAELRFDQGVTEGQGAAAAALGEVREDAQLVEQVDAGAEAALEEVGLDHPQVDELTEPGDLRLQRQALPVAEQVGLLDLRGGDEVLDAGEAGADLEGARRLLGDVDVDVHPVRGRALLRGEVHAAEVTEGRDAASRALQERLAEATALHDLHLPPDHSIAGLGVAPDLDALEAHDGAAHHGDDEVDLVGLRIDLRLG